MLLHRPDFPGLLLKIIKLEVVEVVPDVIAQTLLKII